MAKNILIYTKDFAGEKLLKYIKELKLTPFIATTSKSHLSKKHTGNIFLYKNDFQIFEVSPESYEQSHHFYQNTGAMVQ